MSTPDPICQAVAFRTWTRLLTMPDVRIYVEVDATVPGGIVICATAPDEQQPADVVTAEQQQDGAVGRVEAWVNRIAAHVSDETDTRRITDFRAVLTERTALAARVAEQREDVAAARRERDEAKAETAKLNAYLMLVVARYGNQTFHERDVKRAAELLTAPTATETEES